MREFLTGNQAVVRGALQAGCNYFAGYPITPASSILSEMYRALENGAGIAIQTEDEIAAIGQCIGASMAGAKPMTATSGPGLSLYSENIGLAQIGEVPLVIVDCQRMGPATGGATATGEGDVLFARHVTAGGYPIPVLAATDVTSAYRLTYEAFNIAEQLRTPVILLLSKDISLTRQTADLDAVELPPRTRRRYARPAAPFQPYSIKRSADTPAFAPIGGPERVRFTGSIHGPDGVLTTDRHAIGAKLTHLRDKIDARGEALEYVESDLDREAEILVISYGLNDGAVREAVAELRSRGCHVSHMTLFSLWPVSRMAIACAATPRIRRILVPELNIGLYVEEVRKAVPTVAVESIARFDGGLITPRYIVDQVFASAAHGAKEAACST